MLFGDTIPSPPEALSSSCCFSRQPSSTEVNPISLNEMRNKPTQRWFFVLSVMRESGHRQPRNTSSTVARRRTHTLRTSSEKGAHFIVFSRLSREEGCEELLTSRPYGNQQVREWKLCETTCGCIPEGASTGRLFSLDLKRWDARQVRGLTSDDVTSRPPSTSKKPLKPASPARTPLVITVFA